MCSGDSVSIPGRTRHWRGSSSMDDAEDVDANDGMSAGGEARVLRSVSAVATSLPLPQHAVVQPSEAGEGADGAGAEASSLSEEHDSGTHDASRRGKRRLRRQNPDCGSHGVDSTSVRMVEQKGWICRNEGGGMGEGRYEEEDQDMDDYQDDGIDLSVEQPHADRLGHQSQHGDQYNRGGKAARRQGTEASEALGASPGWQSIGKLPREQADEAAGTPMSSHGATINRGALGTAAGAHAPGARFEDLPGMEDDSSDADENGVGVGAPGDAPGMNLALGPPSAESLDGEQAGGVDAGDFGWQVENDEAAGDIADNEGIGHPHEGVEWGMQAGEQAEATEDQEVPLVGEIRLKMGRNFGHFFLVSIRFDCCGSGLILFILRVTKIDIIRFD